MRFVLLLLLATPGVVQAQRGVVELLVVDDATDAPLPGVRIGIVGQPVEQETDARGRFVYVATRPGTVTLLLRRLGYRPGSLAVDVAAGDTSRVSFIMAAVPRVLSTVDVRDSMSSMSPTLRDFDRRAAGHRGSGTFITRADIEKRAALVTTDLLRRIPSLTIRDSAGVRLAVSRRTQKVVLRSRLTSVAECPLRVAVDGQVTEWGFALDRIPPSDIYGIEVYPGPASIPAEYASTQQDAHCGLIMVWTRRDR